MRRTWILATATTGLVVFASMAQAACPCRHLHRHAVWHSARYVAGGRAFHIPRFSQAQAEAEVHTVYPYRTRLGPPWPDFFAPPE